MSNPLIIDGGILAGGLASRMQGEDKGLQLFKEKPMASWVNQAISPYVRQVIINCNRNKSAYLQISTKLSSDTISGFPGPLAGVISIMEVSDADYFLLSPCDTPLLTQEFAIKMLEFLTTEHSKDHSKPLLFAVMAGEKQQPLHMCIAKEYKNSLKRYLENDEHRVMKWMKDNHAIWLNFSDQAESFRNFNTLEEVNTY
jgi:molybdopterin-guanine dinucleotide biosynthesis protein A